MLPRTRWRCLQCSLTAIAKPSTSVLPSLQPRAAPRHFSTSPRTNSKIGGAPLSIPSGVTFDVIPPPRLLRNAVGKETITVNIKGPLAEISYEIPGYFSIQRDNPESPAVLAVENARIRKQREMWGTVRAYLQNHITGVSEGHNAILRLVGVGYRATIEDTATTVQSEYEGQQFVNLKVGYSHPIELGLPKGVKASTPQPTRILLEGPEKEVLMQFAANIRKWRVPEPYKGKGIFVNGETIKLKNKKIK
ncbi:60S ribosomal protein-like protein L6 [Venturia nashicola]|uniref:60S ribosomal protein-like protein L6 n=1 Tax=Venturia nashicola TaxID=86259 RepID=A0A4Z1P7Y8_9PEZI|nr:60S ribosomal protein-like protein L6 [Venturia nashicola]